MMGWVKSDTITNCFKHGGFQEGICAEETTDPFADLDDKENEQQMEG